MRHPGASTFGSQDGDCTDGSQNLITQPGAPMPPRGQELVSQIQGGKQRVGKGREKTAKSSTHHAPSSRHTDK